MRLETTDPDEFVEVAWSCVPKEASAVSRVSVTWMLTVLRVERLASCALVELAPSFASAVEAFVKVDV